jgi:hypothetical protein
MMKWDKIWNKCAEGKKKKENKKARRRNEKKVRGRKIN